jgi:hypothetical protein
MLEIVVWLVVIGALASGLLAYWQYPRAASFLEMQNRLDYALEWASSRFFLAIFAFLMCLVVKVCQALVNIIKELWTIIIALLSMLVIMGEAIIDVIQYLNQGIRYDVDAKLNNWLAANNQRQNKSAPSRRR